MLKNASLSLLTKKVQYRHHLQLIVDVHNDKSTYTRRTVEPSKISCKDTSMNMRF